jgi:hypothetical protein
MISEHGKMAAAFAAAYIETEGWTQGAMGATWDQTYLPARWKAPACIAGALRLFADRNGQMTINVMWLAQRVTDRRRPARWNDATRWNDAPKRTKEEVLRRLRAYADRRPR